MWLTISWLSRTQRSSIAPPSLLSSLFPTLRTLFRTPLPSLLRNAIPLPKQVMEVDGASLIRYEQVGSFLRLTFKLDDEPSRTCVEAACLTFDTVGRRVLCTEPPAALCFLHCSPCTAGLALCCLDCRLRYSGLPHTATHAPCFSHNCCQPCPNSFAARAGHRLSAPDSMACSMPSELIDPPPSPPPRYISRGELWSLGQLVRPPNGPPPLPPLLSTDQLTSPTRAPAATPHSSTSAASSLSHYGGNPAYHPSAAARSDAFGGGAAGDSAARDGLAGGVASSASDTWSGGGYAYSDSAWDGSVSAQQPGLLASSLSLLVRSALVSSALVLLLLAACVVRRRRHGSSETLTRLMPRVMTLVDDALDRIENLISHPRARPVVAAAAEGCEAASSTGARLVARLCPARVREVLGQLSGYCATASVSSCLEMAGSGRGAGGYGLAVPSYSEAVPVSEEMTSAELAAAKGTRQDDGEGEGATSGEEEEEERGVGVATRVAGGHGKDGSEAAEGVVEEEGEGEGEGELC